MTEPFIGQIIQGGWNFAPRGYSMCNGNQLSITQNSALFSLLGTAFGGNGQTTFGLPNLQGRVMVGAGNGAGLSPYVIGQTAGSESVTLTQNQMPQHTHTLNGTSAKATAQTAAGNLLAKSLDNAGTVVPLVYAPAASPVDSQLAPTSIGIAGGSQPFSILQPYQAVTMCIALEGIFPSRN